MYIEPNTVIKFLKNVPLDTTYNHTLYFDSKSAQTTYFTSMQKYSTDKNTYQRINKGSMRVELTADQLYDCNYVMFQNTGFGVKWFYGFITSVEYLNNVSCTVTFEIDVMQTWFFDYTLRDSFVEREHAQTDTIGNNIVRENLELGEYVFVDHEKAGVSNASSVIVASTVDETGEPVLGGYYGGLYSGADYLKFTPNEANGFFAAMTSDNKANAIISVFMANPDFFANKGEAPAVIEKVVGKKYDNISGYYPENKKLFTYPYNFLYCTNLMGTTADFKYEFFSTGDCSFGLIGEASCNPQVTMLPKNYKIDNLGNLNEKMVLSGFPMCTYNIDAFKAWTAQNGASTAINVLASAGTLVAGTIVSGGLGALAAISAVGSIGGTLAQVSANSAKPPQSNGSSGAGNTYAFGEHDFHFYKTQITADYAIQIDNYFTCYGYATHKTKIPNRNVRPHWTYTKTIDVNIVGSCPSDDLKKICGIYNKGVTFWKNGNEVGDYTLNNKPI